MCLSHSEHIYYKIINAKQKETLQTSEERLSFVNTQT